MIDSDWWVKISPSGLSCRLVNLGSVELEPWQKDVLEEIRSVGGWVEIGPVSEDVALKQADFCMVQSRKWLVRSRLVSLGLVPGERDPANFHLEVFASLGSRLDILMGQPNTPQLREELLSVLTASLGASSGMLD